MKFYKVFYSFVFLLLFSQHLFSQNSGQITAMTLEDAINYAMQNNLNIKNVQINIADAEARIYENRASGLPNVSGALDWQSFFKKPQVVFPASFSTGTLYAINGILNAYGVKDNNGNVIPALPVLSPEQTAPSKVSFQQTHSITPSISVSQLAYSGSYNVAIRAAKEYRALAQRQLDSKKIEIKNQVIDAYLPALLISESVQTFDKNIANLEKLLVETKAVTKAGFAENLDVDKLTLSLDNLKTQRASFLRNKDLVINALKFTIGMPASENIEIKDDVASLSKNINENDLTDVAFDYNKRAEYGLIKQGEKMQALQIDLAKAQALPTVALFASYSYGFQGNSLKKDDYYFLPTGVVGAKVSIPIWNGNILKYTKERAFLAMETTKNQTKMFENGVDLQINNAKIAYRNAKINLESQEKNLKLAEKIYNVAQIKYKGGIGSSIEIIQTESTLYQNQQNVIQARYDLLKTKIDLDKVMGK